MDWGCRYGDCRGRDSRRTGTFHGKRNATNQHY